MTLRRRERMTEDRQRALHWREIVSSSANRNLPFSFEENHLVLRYR